MTVPIQRRRRELPAGETRLTSRTAAGTRLYGVVPTETWSWLMVRAPHSGAWFDLVMTIGSACLVIGVCLLVGRLAPRPLLPESFTEEFLQVSYEFVYKGR